jgi:hypothetical protein
MSKSPVIDIICILDRSGSMRSLEDEVINSFNEFVNDQKQEKGKARLTLILFDDKYEVVYERVKIKKVPELTKEVYFARGMTALFDAIGKTLSSLEAENGMVLIQTDGFENASQEYKKRSVKKLVKEKEELGWDFIFLGANIDAMGVGADFGLAASKTASFTATENGIKSAFTSMSHKTSEYRLSKTQEFQSENKGEEK